MKLEKPLELYKAEELQKRATQLLKYVMSNDFSPNSWEIIDYQTRETVQLDKFIKNIEQLLLEGRRKEACTKSLAFIKSLTPKFYEAKERIRTYSMDLLKIIDVYNAYAKMLEEQIKEKPTIQEEQDKTIEQQKQKMEAFDSIIQLIINRLDDFLKIKEELEKEEFDPDKISKVCLEELQFMMKSVETKFKSIKPPEPEPEEELQKTKKKIGRSKASVQDKFNALMGGVNQEDV